MFNLSRTWKVGFGRGQVVLGRRLIAPVDIFTGTSGFGQGFQYKAVQR